MKRNGKKKEKEREGGLFLSQNGSELMSNQPWQQHMPKSAATNSSENSAVPRVPSEVAQLRWT